MKTIYQTKKLLSHNLKKYLLLYFTFMIYSATTICSKYAALNKMFSMKFFLFVLLEIIFLGFYALIWQQVLKHFSLITAMANKGIVVIFGLLWSVILFHERVSIYNIIGSIIILIGIWVVSKDG